MSLNNISLSPSLLADLYPNVLVQGSSVVRTEKTPLPFLGNNGKRILILTAHKAHAYLPEKELQFLMTVLSACGLDLSHVAIVNWTLLKEKSFDALLGQLSPQKILLLDLLPEEINLPANELYAIRSHGEFEFVVTPSLEEIEKTKQAKSSLWLALKQLFCL